MRAQTRGRNAKSRRGGALVEFALVAVLLLTVMFACFEFSRMLLAYNSLANAAGSGSRYAIVHGNTGAANNCGPGNTAACVAAVRAMAVIGMLNPARLNIAVGYPNGTNQPGSRVTVNVTYAYDPWFELPLRVNLGATSEGVIVY